MKKVLILYASQTGMTADVAARLRDHLTKKLPEYQVVLMSVRDMAVDKLINYPLILFGSSTWDHGIPAPDGEEFLSRLVATMPDLSDNSFALFGLGDSAYSEFCGALPLMQADIQRCYGVVYPEFFTIDGFANEATMTELVKWALNFISESSLYSKE